MKPQRGGEMGRAQVWSVDLFIAVVVFLIGLGIFYFFLSNRPGDDQAKLQLESQVAAERLAGESDAALTTGKTVEDVKLEEFIAKSYEDQKDALGIEGDFCVVLRDQEGNLLLLGEENLTGIGNRNLTLELDGRTGPMTFTCNETYRG